MTTFYSFSNGPVKQTQDKMLRKHKAGVNLNRFRGLISNTCHVTFGLNTMGRRAVSDLEQFVTYSYIPVLLRNKSMVVMLRPV